MDRLQQLSRTNTPPSDEETAEMCTHLPILEEELRHLDIQLAVLHAKRTRLSNQIDMCRAALAPHKRLPPELIREIILFSTTEHAVFPLVNSKKEGRLIVSQVCSTWRAVAFDTPTLWSIKIPYLPAVPSSSLELVGSWLSRCSSACLALNMVMGVVAAAKMESTDWNEPKVKHKFDRIVHNIIIPNPRCFRELALAIPHLSAKTLCTLPSGYFPRLRTLAMLQIDNFFAPFPWNTPVTTFSQTPCLRRCDFVLGGARLHDLQLPWAQLTQLVLVNHAMSNQALSNILAACDSITALHLGCVKFHDSDGNSSPMRALCLPNILVFGVVFAYSPKTSNAPFLLSFFLPNVRRLVLRNTAGPNWSPTDYIAFLSRVSPTLEIFELDFPRLRRSVFHQPPRNVESLLECIPHAKTVRLPNDAPLLPFTMGRISDGTLIPCVEFIEFAAHNPLLALEMLSSRQSSASSLSAVSAGSHSVSMLKASRINCPGRIPEAFKCVRYFHMQGLSVTFHQ